MNIVSKAESRVTTGSAFLLLKKCCQQNVGGILSKKGGDGVKALIAPVYNNIYRAVEKNKYTHYWLKGGRGSGKSSFAALMIIRGIMAEPGANCAALRKVGTSLRDSVYTQLLWAIEMLEAEEFFKAKVSPLEIVYIPTGQKIIFRGADNPAKIKSTKFSVGYCKYIWFEETDQFSGMEEIRNITQSLMRGGDKFSVFYTYNPPDSVHSWINGEVLVQRKDRMIHHSDYRKMPKKWLGKQFVLEARHLEEKNYRKYQHEYLGEVTGTGGEVFKNIHLRAITDEEIKSFEYIKRGLDFGYASDPLHYAVCSYDRKKSRLFIFFEIHQSGMKLTQLCGEIEKENADKGYITADSAEPRSIAALCEAGLRIKGARKGPDSVYYGIKFLQDMEEIVIDPKRCPNTAEEFYRYEYERDKEGGYKASFPDYRNHSIDAVRYALEDSMRSNMGQVQDIKKYKIW